MGGLIAGAWMVRHWGIGYARDRRVALGSGSCPHRAVDRAGDNPALTDGNQVEDSGGEEKNCSLTVTALTDGDRTGDNPALTDWPLVSVIVPAKDEEANIGVCVSSLLDQDYPDYEIIVVDDRSTDATGAIVRELTEAHERGGRLRLLRVESLPQGWFGKHNAMRVGVEAARGAVLCFIDADCRQTSRCTLWAAVAHATERNSHKACGTGSQPASHRLQTCATSTGYKPVPHGVDFLTIIPRLEMVTWWDRVVQPLCAAQLIAWFLPHKVNKRHTKVAYANGMFMLIRRACYEGIGGIEAARDHVNEDIRLAQLTKEHGYRLRVVENEDLYVSRMYRTPSETVRGWARIFHGSLQSRWKVGLSLASWVVLVIVPWVSLLVAVVGCAAGRSSWLSAVVVWGAVVVLAQVAAARLYRMFDAPWVCALAQPLSACVMVGILLGALMQSLGWSRTTWRGTTYARTVVPPVAGEGHGSRPKIGGGAAGSTEVS